MSTPPALKEPGLPLHFHQSWIVLIGLMPFLVFAYYRPIASLIHSWWHNNTYTYCFVIPFISLYVVWTQRVRLSNVNIRPSYVLGFPLLLVSIAVLILSHIGGVAIVGQFSLLFAIASLTLIVGGKGSLRALWFPIAYLIFMLPFWDIFFDRLHLPLQLFSAKLGARILELAGISVNHHGIILELPNITIEVIRRCSGVNFLVAIVAIGISAGYLFLESRPMRVLLVLFSVGIGILANGVRIALIGLFSYMGYGGDIHGPYHVFYGYFVSIVGFVALFAGIRIFGDIRIGSQDRPAPRKVTGSGESKSAMKSISVAAAITGTLLLVVGSYVNFHRSSPVSLKRDLRSLPNEFSGWTGKDVPREFDVFARSGADSEISRIYTGGSGEETYLYLAYFERQEQEKEIINYRTSDLLSKATTYSLTAKDGKIHPVSIVPYEKNGKRKILYYWFHIDGRTIPDMFRAKLYSIFYGVFTGKTNGTAVIVGVDDEEGDDVGRGKEHGLGFIGAIMPILEAQLETN